MTMTCTVCAHADRVAIDEALVGGGSTRGIAGRWSLSKSAVHRHRVEHLSGQLVALEQVRAEQTAGLVLDRLEVLMEQLERLFRASVRVSDSVRVIEATRRCLELIARLTGELKDHAQVQVVNLQAAPEWIETRALILAALAPFPEARAAVAAALAGDGVAGPRMIEGRVVDDGR